MAAFFLMSFAASSYSKLPDFLRAQLSEEALIRLAHYADLLTEVNQRINLISRKDIVFVWEHHIVPSLLFLGWWRFPPKARVLDLGTGGGLPGIPLATAHPENAFVLLDSTRKKVEAVAWMLKELRLDDRCEARWARAESLKERFPYIVGRAVAPLHQFLRWAQRLLLPDGTIYYYTGEPLSSIPSGWYGEFYAFETLPISDPYLRGKGILRIVPAKHTK